MDIVAHSRTLLEHWVSRKNVPPSLCSAWASALWERFDAELSQYAGVPPDLPDATWRDVYLRWERSGRMKRLWPDLPSAKRIRKDTRASADRLLDVAGALEDLGLEPQQCPACRQVDSSFKTFVGRGGVRRWKHHRASCGETGTVSRAAELVLGGPDEAVRWLSERAGEETSPPPGWPVEDDVVLDDGAEEGGDVPVRKGAWYTFLQIAAVWDRCPEASDSPKVREYLEGRLLPVKGYRVALPQQRLQGQAGVMLRRSPAAAYPVYDAAGNLRNIQLRFIDPDRAGRKTLFVNGGNPGSTCDVEGRPYTYGCVGTLKSAKMLLVGEGGPDHASLSRVAGDGCAVLAALSASDMPKLAEEIFRARKYAPLPTLVIPHCDAERQIGDRFGSIGLEAGEALMAALSRGGEIPQGAVLGVSGHRRCHVKYETMCEAALVEMDECRPAMGVSGMALGWDQACAEAWCQLGIPWIAVVPCREYPEGAGWREADRVRYYELLEQAHTVETIQEEYDAVCLAKRNDRIAELSTALLALWDGRERGGTASFVQKWKGPCRNLWWRGLVRVWDWDAATKGLETRDWDANDLLQCVGVDTLRKEVRRQFAD